MAQTPLNRRNFLRAAGVSIALPSLVSVPGLAASTTAAASGSPVRLAWVFFPNGTQSTKWLPEGSGSDWQLTESLQPLAEFKQNLTAFRGLAQINGSALGDGAGDHARSSASFLTGAHPLKTAGSGIRVGRSIDQVLADSYGRATRLPSIELGTEEGRQAGDCDSGYSCAYSNNISWRSESQPMAKEVRPAAAFQRLFGSFGGEGSIRGSVLDAVLDSQHRLMRRVNGNDRNKLDQYFTSLREVESRMQRLSTPVDLGGIEHADPNVDPADASEHIRLMYDMMALAFRTDTTRIATFMLANEGSNRTFPMIGVNDGHHQLSHHKNQETDMEKVARIDRFYSEMFAYFLRQLRDIPDGEDGQSLLDNSLIVYGGSIGDGNRHNHDNLPIILAGHGGGRVAGGQLYKYEDSVPLNNLFLTMADMAGSPVSALGDSTGPLKLS